MPASPKPRLAGTALLYFFDHFLSNAVKRGLDVVSRNFE
jgi:hypothetical protein